MRVIDRKGDVFGTMTPLKGLTYIHDEIYLNEGNSPEVWYEFFEWADNPFLSEEEAKEMTAGMSESELESRRYGRFRSNSGLVYPEFEENVHVVDPMAGRRRRKRTQTDAGQTDLHGDPRQVRGPHLFPSVRTGDAHGDRRGVISACING